MRSTAASQDDGYLRRQGRERGRASVPVSDNAFAPHLKAGEWAVIEPDDDEPVAGEVYVVKISSPLEAYGYRLRFVQLRPSLCILGEQDERGRGRPEPEPSGRRGARRMDLS